MNNDHPTLNSDLACRLYPRGVDDKAIWTRAGGDLAMLNLNSTAKGQWSEALRLLKNGGGGGINWSSLLSEMKIDFPGNKALVTILDAMEAEKGPPMADEARQRMPLPPLAQARKHIEQGKPIDAIDDIRIYLQHPRRGDIDARETDNILTVKMSVLNDLKQKARNGLLKDDELTRRKNLVNFALLQIIDELEGE